MRYLSDTHWIISYLNGTRDALELFASLENDELAISQATYGEIYDGIYRARDPRRAERDFRRLLRLIDILPLNLAIWRRFARIRGELRARGQLIPDMDILIAATALQHDLTLVTRNRRHFQRVAGLSLL
jgi:tRNA(fMet)-specific endonuclease VapC